MDALRWAFSLYSKSLPVALHLGLSDLHLPRQFWTELRGLAPRVRRLRIRCSTCGAEVDPNLLGFIQAQDLPVLEVFNIASQADFRLQSLHVLGYMPRLRILEACGFWFTWDRTPVLPHLKIVGLTTFCSLNASNISLAMSRLPNVESLRLFCTSISGETQAPVVIDCQRVKSFVISGFDVTGPLNYSFRLPAVEVAGIHLTCGLDIPSVIERFITTAILAPSLRRLGMTNISLSASFADALGSLQALEELELGSGCAGDLAQFLQRLGSPPAADGTWICPRLKKLRCNGFVAQEDARGPIRTALLDLVHTRHAASRASHNDLPCRLRDTAIIWKPHGRMENPLAYEEELACLLT